MTCSFCPATSFAGLWRATFGYWDLLRTKHVSNEVVFGKIVPRGERKIRKVQFIFLEGRLRKFNSHKMLLEKERSLCVCVNGWQRRGLGRLVKSLEQQETARCREQMPLMP